MASPITKGLIVGASLLGGLLAGPAMNKALIEIPAWREIGALPWSSFTRAADLHAGPVLYPAIGFGALILTVAAAVAYRFDSSASPTGAIPVYGAALLAIFAFAATTQILAPATLRLRELGDDAAAAQQAFAVTAPWWVLKGILHALTFVANLWGLSVVLPMSITMQHARKSAMTSARTRRFLFGATLLGGLLAGGNIDRAIVQNTAWRELGATAWAAYSRHADLSPRGFAYYPFLGIGGALLSVAAALSFRRDRSTSRTEAIPVYAAALLMIGGLLATTQAAPIMLSVRGLGDDPKSLEHAMEGFMSWGSIRGLFQEGAFFATLWALTATTVNQRRDRVD